MKAEMEMDERPRILVADDQDDIVQSLEMLLRREGCEVVAAQSPAAVLAALRRSSFDLLLMDMNYTCPSHSAQEGLDLLREVERIDSQLSVVVMTAWGSIDLAVEAMRNGAANFVQKPWDNKRLLQIVREQAGRCRIRRRQERRRIVASRELDEAEALQRAFLPPALPEIERGDLTVRWQPYERLGGDYYDVFRLDSRRIGFCLADAAGKGIPAALLVSNLQAGLRSLAQEAVEPVEVVTRLNRLLCANRLTNKFVTLFYGLLDIGRMTLTYANAGHPPMYIRRPDGGQAVLKETGGLVGLIPDWTYGQESIRLERGDRMWLFTDGILEARDAAGSEFGPTRLEELLEATNAAPLAEARDGIWRAVLEFCGGELEDDATILGFQLDGRPS